MLTRKLARPSHSAQERGAFSRTASGGGPQAAGA